MDAPHPRTPEDTRADVERARQILATSLLKSPEQVEDGAAIMLAAGSWWIEDLLAKPAANWLLGQPGRELLDWLGAAPDAFLTPPAKEFQAALGVLRAEAAHVRLPATAHAAERLLLRLLGVVWQLATGRAMSRSDRDDTPFGRFLETMVNPRTGLPGIAALPAAATARKRLSQRILARTARGGGTVKPPP